MGELTIHKPSAVEVRRGLVKMPVVLGALDPMERTIFVASTAKTIAEYDGRELAGELAAALKWICKDVGYRVSDAEDMQYIVIRTAEILRRYYSTMTLKDFRLAFEMCLTGELDEYLPKDRSGVPDRSHYQAFNAEYVCKVLNAYKGRRLRVLSKANEAAPKERYRDMGEEAANWAQVKRDCVGAFLHYKYRGWLPAITPIAEMLYYKLLAWVGLADDIEVTMEEQREILQRLVNSFACSGRYAEIGQLKREGLAAADVQYKSAKYGRRKALEATFARMVLEEVQITDFIKF